MKKAFTLIELLVVITIVGIVMGALAMVSFGQIKKSYARNDMASLEDIFFMRDKNYSTPHFSWDQRIMTGVFELASGAVSWGAKTSTSTDYEFYKFRVIRIVKPDWSKWQPVAIFKKAYNLWCFVDGGADNLQFRVKTLSKDYCWDIDLSICKMKLQKCQD